MLLIPSFKFILTRHSDRDLVLRGDSGFAVPELYDLCEQQPGFYAIRLKDNRRLSDTARELAGTYRLPAGTAAVLYTDFPYRAASWSHARRVVVKLERPEGELFFQPTFIVTHMNLPAKQVVRFYQNRGTMENLIKEGKNGFAFD